MFYNFASVIKFLLQSEVNFAYTMSRHDLITIMHWVW